MITQHGQGCKGSLTARNRVVTGPEPMSELEQLLG
jgi:hypothetical protein